MVSILVADDNALSLAFLLEVVRSSGRSAHGAADGLAALALARTERFDLLLLDLAMPGLGGVEVLHRLRADAEAASRHSPTIATSAEFDGDRRRSLLAQGFVACLPKPIDVASLQAMLQRHLQGDAHVPERDAPPAAAAQEAHRDAGLPLLDDAAGLRATGDAGVLAALRGLFARELEALPEELADLGARGDDAGWRDRLHRLRASCGFCGALALDAACQALRAAVPADAAPDRAALEALVALAAATRARLPDPPA